MVILLISLGLIPATEEPRSVFISPVESASLEILTTSSTTTPSITQSGLLSPERDVAPRILSLGAVPKVPDTFCTDTPANCPSNIWETFDIPGLSTSSTDKVVDDP